MTGLPASINHGTVTGKLISAVQLPASDADIDASPISGTVTFTPSVPRVIHAGSSTIIVPGPVTVTLDGAGAFTTKLIATNDADLNPVDWTYLVSFALNGGVTLDPFSIALPVDSTLDLSSVVTVPPSEGLLSHTHAAADVTAGIFATARLGSGAADSTKFLRGDSTWAVPGAGSDPWTYVIATVDTSNSTVTAVNCTGLTLTGLADGLYALEGVILGETALTTTGIQVGLSQATSGAPIAAFMWGGGSNGTTQVFRNVGTSEPTAAVPGAGTSVATPALVIAATLIGVFRVATMTGSIDVTVKSEVAASNVTVKADSFLRYRRLSA